MKLIASSLLIWLRRIVTLILAILSLYGVTAFFGAIIPANPLWTNPLKSALSGPGKIPPDSVDIFVETNGIHVSIILPMHHDNGILSNKLRASHMQKPQYHSQYAMIGWGHKGVYQNAQNWNDLTFADASSALLGSGDALLHIYYRNNPKANAYRKKIRITRDQYINILRNISGYFKYDENENLRSFSGYGADNIFYEAHGSYSAINTCNVWVGKILREAGLKIGYWTPFSQSIMYRF